MKIKSVLIYGIGVISGFIASNLLDKFLPGSSKESLNVFDTSKISEGIKKGYGKKLYTKPRIDVTELNHLRGFDNGENNSNCEDNARKVADGAGISSDDKQYKSAVSNESFDTLAEASKRVDGTVNITHDDDPIVTSTTLATKVVSISAPEFVKAVAAGAQMSGFIFNVSDKKLYWPYLNREVTQHEIAKYIGTFNYAELITEAKRSSLNMITPKYYYNDDIPCYIKIESGVAGK